LGLSVVPAFAQGRAVATQKPLDEALQGAAHDAYTYAKMLFDNGDFAGALAKYAQAYRQSKDPRLLFNMAVCDRNLRAYARMQSLLQQYEAESGAALSATERASVDAALKAVENLVGKVTLGVDPPGAAISVDGVAVGTAPLASPLVVDLGKHTIAVKSAGFEDAEQTVDVAGGVASELSVHLTPQRRATAHLVVAADGGATVAIDGSPTGLGRFDGPLAAGVHDVNVTEPGKLPYTAQVDLRDGETRSVEVTLHDEKRSGALVPWLVGGAVVVAGAAVGGYFLFKTSDHPAALNGEFATVHFSAFGGQ
jgi:hypothetical protein